MLMNQDKEFIRYFNLKLYFSRTKSYPQLGRNLFFENNAVLQPHPLVLDLIQISYVNVKFLKPALLQKRLFQSLMLSRSTTIPFTSYSFLFPLLNNCGVLYFPWSGRHICSLDWNRFTLVAVYWFYIKKQKPKKKMILQGYSQRGFRRQISIIFRR